MPEISINTGLIRLEVNRDGARVGAIAFNPNDVGFVERYYALYQSCDEKIAQYQKELDKLEEGDYPGQFALIHKAVQELEVAVDDVFGPGTSKTAFGDAETLDMFSAFFAAIIPHIQKSREQMARKYRKAGSDTLE